MKKLFATLLALVMVLSLATVAFAAGEGTPGTITVENPIEGQTYTAYKIFDVVYDTNEDGTAGNHYAYTIDSGSEWFTTVQNYANGEGSGLTLTQANGTDTPAKYVVEIGTGFSAPAFAKTLKANTNGKTATKTEFTDTADGKKVANVQLGYYFVTSSTGAMCNLTTTNPAVTIRDKNDMPFEKTVDKASADVGETVNFKIMGRVPDTSEFTKYDYVVTDKMSDGLTFKADSIKIYISDDATLDTATDNEMDTAYYTKVTEGATAFGSTTDTVDFRVDFKAKDMNAANLAGKYIFITYSATVNEKAIAQVEDNNATLTYSNDPTNNDQHGTTTDEVTVHSAKIVIDKYAENKEDTNDKNTKLAGAKFVLMNSENKYYSYDETQKAVQWVTNQTDADEVTTDENGAAHFEGLKDGTYKLVETAAPAGYNLLKNPVTVEINHTEEEVKTLTTAEAQTIALTATASVANSTGSELPDTGGIGTTIFYVVGAVLVLGAVVALVTKRKLSVME